MVVDLESITDPVMGTLVVQHIHRHTAPKLPLLVVGPNGTETFMGAAGIVVTGCSAMLEEVDWAVPLASAVVEAAGSGTPVLGICFGHQMLAVHLGGRLSSFDEVRKGLPVIAFEAAGPFAAESVPVVHTHRDHVTRAPPSMRAVATGGFGGIAALAHGRLPLWTMQGHPEWDQVVCRQDGDSWGRFEGTALDTPGSKGILSRFGDLVKAKA